jgi:cupin domain
MKPCGSLSSWRACDLATLPVGPSLTPAMRLPQLRLHVGEASHDLAAGDSVSFSADKAHRYENPGTTERRYHDLILYEH